MKKTVLLLISVLALTANAQSPGGVAGSEIWCKVNKVTPTGSTFQYKDFTTNNKAFTLGAGTVLTPSFFNYNYSFSYDNTDHFSYLSKLESLKDATIFIVNLPTPPSDPSVKYGLLSTDWNSSVTVPSGSSNEQSFKLSTSTFEKDVLTLTYPSEPSARPNGRINTLLWHNFNSKKIVNSFGSNGESNIFIGKSFTDASNFVGQIPEVIVYRKALNDKEKWRVDSYLALKYGITLQPDVNYYTSKNEIFWHKENNELFKNRIFGLGRDSNSGLYQKQSTSIHDSSVLKKMIFWMGTLQEDNNLNTSYIEDQSFLCIGDTNEAETANTLLNNGIKKLDRTWLAEKFGPSAHNLVTSLKYKPDSSITLLPNEAFWLLVDKNANNTTLSDFNGSDISYFPVDSFDSDGYAIYTNLKWASDTTTYNQFTFGVGPRMLVIPTVLPLACTDTQGTVNIEIKGGQPVFTINVHGTDNPYNLQLNQPGFDLALSLNTGNYQVTVTDSTGFTQSATFEVSATPGIALELGADQYLISGNSIIFDASSQVTSATATYQWFQDGNVVATTPILSVTEQGNYQCIITDTTSGCTVEDSIEITLVQEFARGNYSSIYPNPTKAADAFTVKIHLDTLSFATISIFDVTSKTLEYRNLVDAREHEQSFILNTAGIYFVKIDTREYSTTHKIIIN